MQPRSLDQILSSLDSVYNPQVQSIQNQMSAIPGQVAEQEKGLAAKQETAFGDILNGARRRGTGVAFGGIPLSEQAQYTAGTYLPALANLRTAATQQQTSLADAINKINADRFTQGQGIYQYETSLAEQRRQFDEQQKLSREQAAASASAAAAFNPTLNGLAAPTAKTDDPLQAKTLNGGRSLQDAYNAIETLMATKDTNWIRRNYDGILKSANNGNSFDKAKLQIITQVYGQSLLKNGIGTQKLTGVTF